MAAVDRRVTLAAGALWVLALLGCKAGAPGAEPGPAPADRKPAAADPGATSNEPHAAVQPRPGERVRQPLLDGYCDETDIPVAFYYHGGRPVARVAVRDGCSPLYVPECDEQGTCMAREAEQGMWCCKDPLSTEARAERP